jgi:2-methylaconitate cis-trans-isomerase PrpF
VSLAHQRPGHPRDGSLFPSGGPVERLTLEDHEIRFTASHATLPVAWVLAEDVGLDPGLLPDAIDAEKAACARLDRIRREAAVRMGLASSPEEASLAAPKVGVVGRPQAYRTLAGEQVGANDVDIVARMISMERAHKAIPLTGGMCLAATCLAAGSLPYSVCRPDAGPEIRIGTPSGVLTTGAALEESHGVLKPARTLTYATARRLMEGWVRSA